MQYLSIKLTVLLVVCLAVFIPGEVLFQATSYETLGRVLTLVGGTGAILALIGLGTLPHWK